MLTLSCDEFVLIPAVLVLIEVEKLATEPLLVLMLKTLVEMFAALVLIDEVLMDKLVDI